MRFALSLFFCLLVATAARAQCDGLHTVSYMTTYAVRTANILRTYTQGYTVGADAAYFTTSVVQSDRLNGVQYATPISATAGPRQTATVSRSTDVNQQGFGTYQAIASLSGYDACTHISVPPFNNASQGTSSAAYKIDQPVINTPPPLYVSDFTNCQPGTSCGPYSNRSVLTASTGQASGTPTWTLTGNPQMLSISCTTCTVATITTTSAAKDSCTPSVQAYYTVDGIRSRTANILILGALVAEYGSPVHSAITKGYDSTWPFQTQNSCGSPMFGLAMSESFPSGFSFKIPNTNWPTPKPNSWTSNNNGLFVDEIGEAGDLIPAALAPQSPLGSTVVFDGGQYFNVNNKPVRYQTQAHYLDHGGYE